MLFGFSVDIGNLTIAVTALIALVWQQLSSRHARREDQVFAAYPLFTGRTQRRSVGLSMLEGSWESSRHLRRVFVPLLVYQAIYLLTNGTNSKLERQNLRRILRLVSVSSQQPHSFRRRWDTPGSSDRYAQDYKILTDTICERLAREDKRIDPGSAPDAENGSSHDGTWIDFDTLAACLTSIHPRPAGSDNAADAICTDDTSRLGSNG